MIYTRRAFVDDVAELMPLCRAFHQESPVHRQLAFDEAKVTTLLTNSLEHPDWLGMVAVNDDGAIVGMMLLFCIAPYYSSELQAGELCLWVKPEHRGGRSAWLLATEAKRWAELKGARKLQMGVTTGINDDLAERFYRKMGLTRCGVLLQCEITPSR